MKRRRFLQMSAAAVAGTALQPFSSAFASRPYLRVVSVADESGPTLVLHSATVSVAEDNSLLVSGWVEDDVLHLMLETPRSSSCPPFVFPALQPGSRQRVRLMNATSLDVPLRLPTHQLELKRVQQAPVQSTFTNAIMLKRYSVVEASLFV